MRALTSGSELAQSFDSNLAVNIFGFLEITTLDNSQHDFTEVVASSLKLMRKGFDHVTGLDATSPYLGYYADPPNLIGNVSDDTLVTSNGMKKFWKVSDVYNNKETSPKWLVCDCGAQVYDVADGNGFRAIPMTESDFERGWWSGNKSDGSGNFDGSEYVLAHWNTPKAMNRFKLTLPQGYSNIRLVNLYYRDSGLNYNNFISIEIPEDTYVWESNDYNFSDVTGLVVEVLSTWRPNDYARVLEFNGMFVENVSTDSIISMDISDTREEYNSTVPIGTTEASTLNFSLSNTDGYWTLLERPELGRGNKVVPYFGLYNGSNDEYIKMGEFWVDQWQSDSGGMVTSASCRDASRFLQDDATHWGKSWVNTTAEGPIREILQLAGIPNNKIQINPANLNTFDILFMRDTQPWSFLGEIALADMAYFGFDSDGVFRYEAYSELPVAGPIADFSHDTNIQNGTLNTQIYANKITVKVSPYNTDSIKTASVWNAPSPTILSYGILTDELLVDNTTSLTMSLGARQSTESTETTVEFLWPTKNGLIWLPQWTVQLDGSFLLTGGELIKYDTCDNATRTFTGLHRGYLGTPISYVWPGSYAGEARVFEMEFSNSPVISVNYPFVTAIDVLLTDPAERTAQAYVVFWEHDAFKGKLVVGNMVEFNTWLAGTGETLKDFDDQAHDIQINFATAISGTVIADNGSEKIKESIENPTGTINNLIRRYGKNEIEINNNWIQSVEHAQKIVNFYINQYNSPRRIVSLNCTGDLRIETGDLIRVVLLEELGINNVLFHVISVNYSYDGGLNMSMTIREIAD